MSPRESYNELRDTIFGGMVFVAALVIYAFYMMV